MRKLAHSLARAAFLLLAVQLAPAAGAQGFQPGERARLRAAGVDAAVLDRLAHQPRVRVIVALEQRQDEAGVLASLSAGDGRVLRRYKRLRRIALEVGPGALARVAEAPGVRRVGPDVQLELQLAQAVPLVGLDALHTQGYDGTGATVAVIDTGVDSDHPALEDNLVAHQCFCSVGGGCCPPGDTLTGSGVGSSEDETGHGTKVTGAIVSTASGMIGGAPGASLIMVKIFDENSNGVLSDALAALDWIADERPEVDVVNLSFGSGLYAGDCDTADTTTEDYVEAIAPLLARGTLVVAGSGNNGSGTSMIAPACLADVVSVGAVWDADVGSRTAYGCTDATTAADQVTCWSNASTTTDVFAPGGRTLTTNLVGGIAAVQGTSYSTPIVSACAAVIKGIYPNVSSGALAARLRLSPTQVTDATNGLSYPRLACGTALASVSSSIPALPGGPAAVVAMVLGLAALGLALGRGRRPVRRR